MMIFKNTIVSISFLVFLLFAVVVVSLCLGRYPVTWGEINDFLAAVLSGKSLTDCRKLLLLKNLFIDIRLPRIVAAMLVGASLSVSGAAFQSMFINPLVSPGLLGVLAGACFGAALGMVVTSSWLFVQVSSVACGLLAVCAAIGMAALYRGDRLLMLILGGIISSALFTSLLSVVKYLADPYSQLPAIVYWLMGGFSTIDAKTVWAVSLPMTSGIVILISLANYLNILSMGDEEAQCLGVNVRLIRMALIFPATLISALTVALGGMIGWVGLVIPHIARMIVGPDNRKLLPASAVIGAVYLLVVDDISRLAFTVEIPIGILTSLVGIPFFALILGTSRKGWN
ncbi:iron ABC transporter permease [uncultured Desulfobacter sp.]|uniref:FecCD family ABC transporter permease n=1 Tax=uncultured Desulfobacter sp. TaxID=240139 RepID=UPI002AAB553D|nr:iron ABC transporter permease [uncultured Desulfobacter sp.]